MRECEKKHCPQCRGKEVQRYGKSRHGKQRWYCLKCRRSFSWNNGLNRRSRQKVWFKRWIMEGYSLRQLAHQSGHSISTLGRINRYWLQRSPRPRVHLFKARYLIFDGTMIENRRGPFAMMNALDHSVVYAQTHISESPVDLTKFCNFLYHQGLFPQSATVDGNPHMIRILRLLWPELLIQRCLFHIQRQGLMWCRRFPKRADAKHLRNLFLTVNSIRKPSHKNAFITEVNRWEDRYGQRIAACPESGWVFSDLKRARSMLLTALPDMFHYLQDHNIPSSTNALEGYFSRLKQKYRQHRGLPKHHRLRYFNWYFHLCPR